MTLHLKDIVPIRPFRMEALVQAQELIPQSKDLITSQVGEFFGIADGQYFSLTPADFLTGSRGHSEVISGKREDFLPHLKGLFAWMAEPGIRAEGRVERSKRRHVLRLSVE